jgi:cation transport regulator ChaC
MPHGGALESLLVSERTEVSDPAVWLFQYGSNMDQDWFSRQRKKYEAHAPAGASLEARLLGRARLDGWRFHTNLWSAGRARRKRSEPSLSDRESCRVANIMREDGAVGWGALYEISSALVTRCDGERSVLDRIEGHRTTSDPENYAKICVTVDLDGESRTAWTYIGLNDAIKRCETEHPGSTCDTDYGATVIRGAGSIGVPEDYLEDLRRALGAAA